MDAQKGLSVITRKLLATPEGQYYDFKATLDALKVANMVARARLRAHAMDANDKAPRLHTGGIPSWARIASPVHDGRDSGMMADTIPVA